MANYMDAVDGKHNDGAEASLKSAKPQLKMLKGKAALYINDGDNSDWNECFEPSSYDDAEGLEDFNISWSINPQHVNLGRKLLNDNIDLKTAIFSVDVEIALAKKKRDEEFVDRLRLEVIRGEVSPHPMVYLSFQSSEGRIHYFNITDEVVKAEND